MTTGIEDQDHGGDVAAVVRGLAARGITGLPEQHLAIVLAGAGSVPAAVAEVAESEWWTVEGWEPTWED